MARPGAERGSKIVGSLGLKWVESTTSDVGWKNSPIECHGDQPRCQSATLPRTAVARGDFD
jgi:hypothetical protein